jgi:predicted DsbA family dithiol-disulfide isomerase
VLPAPKLPPPPAAPEAVPPPPVGAVDFPPPEVLDPALSDGGSRLEPDEPALQAAKTTIAPTPPIREMFIGNLRPTFHVSSRCATRMCRISREPTVPKWALDRRRDHADGQRPATSPAGAKPGGGKGGMVRLHWRRMNKLQVDVWSDIACPWCYVGKRRLEAALARFPRRDAVAVTWRAFELDPSAPRERDDRRSYAARLADKYGSTVPEAEAKIAAMTELGKTDGLSFRFDRIRPGNTFDAHRLVHLAADRGAQDAVKERFLLAYMTEGEAIGDPETLVRLASESGLDAAEVRAVLSGDAYARSVRDDEAEAARLGIHGVPFFVLDGRYGISGAQSAQTLLGALTEAWEELEQTSASLADGAACGPDGCPPA